MSIALSFGTAMGRGKVLLALLTLSCFLGTVFIMFLTLFYDGGNESKHQILTFTVGEQNI
jgi:hypothetical protein